MFIVDGDANPPKKYSFEGIPDESWSYLLDLKTPVQLRYEVDAERLRASGLALLVHGPDEVAELLRSRFGSEYELIEAFEDAHVKLVNSVAELLRSG